MWTSQVYGHRDKMARTKTHRKSQNTEYTKTQQTLRNNYFFVFFGFFCFFNLPFLISLRTYTKIRNITIYNYIYRMQESIIIKIQFGHKTRCKFIDDENTYQYHHRLRLLKGSD